MTDAQLRAAHQLVSLLDGDAVAQADANTYGNAFRITCYGEPASCL